MSIKFSIIESAISNSCFLILLVLTIYYWGKIIFFSNSNDTSPTISIRGNNFFSNFGFFGFSLVNLLLSIQLIGRWLESGHFPLSGLYESLIFLSWALIFLYLIIEYKSKTELIGIIISPSVLCILAFSGFNLPLELQQNKPLVPALQSNWLFMHVSVMMLSYAALILGSLISIMYLVFFVFNSVKNKNFTNTQIKTPAVFENGANSIRNKTQIEELTRNPWNTDSQKNEESELIGFSSKETNFGESLVYSQQSSTNFISIFKSPFNFKNIGTENFSNLIPLEVFGKFENLSYRLIGIGFCFLTLGILSGAVWANETWGSYWSWDPKETWALITWLTFAIYLHTRILQGWKGVKSASIASFGFFIIWFCYLGVNLLGKGLHSYGFFTS